MFSSKEMAPVLVSIGIW